MTHLLDTNACVSHLRSSHSRVSARLAASSAGDVVICSVVKAELIFGALRSVRPQENLSALNAFFSLLPSLPFDDAAAVIYGNIRATLTGTGTPIGPNDLLIASIAVTHRLILVTRNTREFSRISGLRIEDWESIP